jgi:protein N-terminal glutamine amidohydrolase
MDTAHKYTPFYCEENIWQLAQARANGSAIFISNSRKQVACFSQKRAKHPGEPMVWDYHVIWLEEGATGATIWDFDSTLALGTSAQRYLTETFRPVRDAFAPMFRVVAKDDFIREFASDRSHMKRADGSYAEAPPVWPCIGEDSKRSNLASFVSMEGILALNAPGEVLSFEVLVARILRTKG